MEKSTEDKVRLIANKINLPVQRVYILFSRIGLLSHVSKPTPHWEETSLWFNCMEHASLQALIDKVKEENYILEDGPDLGAPPEHQMKVCSNCRKKKRWDLFFESDKREDGLTLWCKDCLADLNNS
ncbi:hypothetical protein HF888_01140 [Bermanella marisrubri]|uniref:Uncharacterized protein n=1 Tax=Bermanella marisrubri TaxID=207949 RepID=Q1N4B6_9GAMM|nr:hypothetical protein RED65_14672 [Oceanobacter sp. RED65] [Bermanella marisrubri]QIZ82922.1 hypothetical protein HF888_01140 [Bermanella marisrubri]